MRILITSIIFLSLIQGKVFGQADNEDPINNKQAIIAGTWGYTRSIVAVMYERFFITANNQNLLFAARTGIGYSPGIKSINLKGVISVPVLFSVLLGKKKNFFQLSVGYTSSFGKEGIDSTVTPPAKYLKYEASYCINLGYRFMEYKGATFEVTPISLIWTNNPDSRFMWSFGFSVGGAF